MFHIPTLAFIFPLLKQKRQYDLHGEEGSVAELGSVNVEDLGTVGRLFGALVSKAGIPVPTEITQKVHYLSSLYRQGTLIGRYFWIFWDTFPAKV